MKIEIKNLMIVVLALALAITLVYFLGFGELNKYCQRCRQEGIEDTLLSIVNDIRTRGVGLRWTEIDEEKDLICNLVDKDV